MNESNKPLSAYYKVPFRDVHCETLWLWFVAVARCHIWRRVFR